MLPALALGEAVAERTAFFVHRVRLLRDVVVDRRNAVALGRRLEAEQVQVVGHRERQPDRLREVVQNVPQPEVGVAAVGIVLTIPHAGSPVVAVAPPLHNN